MIVRKPAITGCCPRKRGWLITFQSLVKVSFLLHTFEEWIHNEAAGEFSVGKWLWAIILNSYSNMFVWNSLDVILLFLFYLGVKHTYAYILRTIFLQTKIRWKLMWIVFFIPHSLISMWWCVLKISYNDNHLTPPSTTPEFPLIRIPSNKMTVLLEFSHHPDPTYIFSISWIYISYYLILA